MAVFTEQEYEKYVENQNILSKEQKDFLKPWEKPKTTKVSDKIYFLMHPENSDNRLNDFEDDIKINDISYKRKCRRGVIKTEDEPLMHFLKSKGYFLLDVKKKEDIEYE
jgi:hypothetical protein